MKRVQDDFQSKFWTSCISISSKIPSKLIQNPNHRSKITETLKKPKDPTWQHWIKEHQQRASEVPIKVGKGTQTQMGDARSLKVGASTYRKEKSKVSVKFTSDCSKPFARDASTRHSTWQCRTCTYTGCIIICIVLGPIGSGHARARARKRTRYRVTRASTKRYTAFAYLCPANSEHVQNRGDFSDSQYFYFLTGKTRRVLWIFFAHLRKYVSRKDNVSGLFLQKLLMNSQERGALDWLIDCGFLCKFVFSESQFRD